MITIIHWLVFNLIIFTLLGIDLYRSYRNPHRIDIKEAIITSCIWISLAFLFNGWIYLTLGSSAALDFLTGYLIEKSLSIDNLFIFILIFAHFQVPKQARHLVLFYGVLGAIIMRALLIWAGIELVEHFEWVFLIFGLFLIIAGIRLAIKRESEEELEESYTYRLLKKMIPFTGYHGTAFFVKQKGLWMATPLFAALILIEISDLIFALDSVPAIFGITTDPFIVYTSNIFAILGLRSLYFVLEKLIQTFHLLHYALAFILIFIGTKMLIADFVKIPTWVTFMVLIGSITLAVATSIRKTCN